MPIARAPICEHRTYAHTCTKCAEIEDDEGFEIELDIDLGEDDNDATEDDTAVAE